MDFSDQIQALAAKAPKQLQHIETEEATKNAFVMPFIAALGYNVFDPTEVVPEFTADVGVKKGEKVDYAILQDGKPVIIVECKSSGTDLETDHMSQLFRYFAVTPARIGVLTNGIDYHFFTDLEERNKMDQRPFLVLNLLDLNESLLGEVKRLGKDQFDVEEVISAAGELKYTRALSRYLTSQFAHPDEEFLRFLVKHIFSGRVTERVLEDFAPVVKRALRQFVNQQVNQRLRSALEDESDSGQIDDEPAAEEVVAEPEDDNGIVTTEEEIEAYLIIKSILREVVEPDRVAMRDLMSYCSILLDDNNRKPLARLHFNRSQKYLGVFDADKNEERIPIEALNDIFQHADRLKATPPFYE